MEKTTEQQVFRQVAFPVSAFDYLKDFQRGYERKHGVRLTNNQALTIIINEHHEQNPINVERGVRNEQCEGKARG